MGLMLTSVTYAELTAFRRLSNQHTTLSHHHDTWPATAGDLHYEGLLKSHIARCWVSLPQRGNVCNHYKANLN